MTCKFVDVTFISFLDLLAPVIGNRNRKYGWLARLITVTN